MHEDRLQPDWPLPEELNQLHEDGGVAAQQQHFFGGLCSLHSPLCWHLWYRRFGVEAQHLHGKWCWRICLFAFLLVCFLDDRQCLSRSGCWFFFLLLTCCGMLLCRNALAVFQPLDSVLLEAWQLQVASQVEDVMASLCRELLLQTSATERLAVKEVEQDLKCLRGLHAPEFQLEGLRSKFGLLALTSGLIQLLHAIHHHPAQCATS
mmetsp:Transcript_64391/g.104160  ORF Transcript_64391/g.104160 Transcript_64391/m.104160 type:complete len:207 (+) Transcript_64391:717-1337(+)